MQIDIVSTGEFAETPFRTAQRYLGRTAGGIEVYVYVSRVCVKNRDDQRSFENELITTRHLSEHPMARPICVLAEHRIDEAETETVIPDGRDHG